MLLPDDANGNVLRRMAEQGDDLTRPRNIDFIVVFANESSAVRTSPSDTVGKRQHPLLLGATSTIGGKTLMEHEVFSGPEEQDCEANLKSHGRRLDAPAPPLCAHIAKGYEVPAFNLPY